MRIKPGLALLVMPFIAGCITVNANKPAPVAAPTPPPVAPSASVPADDLLQAVLWMQRAVEHDLVFREIYRAAEERLPAAIADPTWDALPRGDRSSPPVGLPPVVIFDVDETVLDNSPYEAMLIKTGQEYSESTWSQWCKKESARPLPGALEFARFAEAHGVAVVYITNRAVDLIPATIENLRKAGFPVADDSAVLGLGTVVPGCEMHGTDKGCRRRLVGRDHRVLMQFGDQIVDFVDVVANTPSGREQAVAPYASWIGERWWVLPNPLYGSWEPACFGNDWRLKLDQRRARKIDCLRTE